MEMKEILKSRRIELNLTQKEVADFVGVSEATLSRWETGEIKNLKRNRISALAKILQLSPSTIVGDMEDDPAELPPKQTISENDIKAAFWGGEKDLSQEDIDELWADAMEYIAFKTEKKKRKK